MVIGTALGFSEWGTVALAVGLAFLFGYSLTSLHAVLHNSGHHPPVPTRIVAAVAAAAFVSGSAVLIAEVLDDDPPAHQTQQHG